MVDVSKSTDGRLAGYLHSLPAGALLRLAHQLDHLTFTDDLDSVNSLILDAARDALAAHGPAGAIAARPERAAFAIAEPFRIDTETADKLRGRIPAASLREIWIALVRGEAGSDLAAAVRGHAAAILEAESVPQALALATPEPVSAALVDLYQRAAEAEDAGVPGARRVAGRHGLENLADLVAIDSLSAKLSGFIAEIDAQDEWSGPLDAERRELLAAALEPFADEELVYPLVVQLGRMAQPGSLVNLLVDAEETDDPLDLQSSRFSPAVDVLLDELDVLAAGVSRCVADGQIVDGVIPRITRFHAICTNLGVAIDFEIASPWSARIAALRSAIADTLREPLDKLPSLLRMGVHPAGSGTSAPDPIDTEQAVATAELLMAVKPLRSELAMNECVFRLYAAVENFIDVVVHTLPQKARQAEPAELPGLAARFAALHRVAGIIFGAEYAALLRRSGENAGLHLPEDAASRAA